MGSVKCPQSPAEWWGVGGWERSAAWTRPHLRLWLSKEGETAAWFWGQPLLSSQGLSQPHAPAPRPLFLSQSVVGQHEPRYPSLIITSMPARPSGCQGCQAGRAATLHCHRQSCFPAQHSPAPWWGGSHPGPAPSPLQCGHITTRPSAGSLCAAHPMAAQQRRVLTRLCPWLGGRGQAGTSP